jgi:hypothetical protein
VVARLNGEFEYSRSGTGKLIRPLRLRPQDGERVFVHDGPGLFAGPVLVNKTSDDWATIETAAGLVEDVGRCYLTKASLVDVLVFQAERDQFVSIAEAEEAEHRWLADANQDLAVGARVRTLSNFTLDEIALAIDRWASQGERPEDWIPLLLDRDRLWLECGEASEVIRPPHEVGKPFKLLGVNGLAQRRPWYQVRPWFDVPDLPDEG